MSKLGSNIDVWPGDAWRAINSKSPVITIPDNDIGQVDSLRRPGRTVVLRARERLPNGTHFPRMFSDLGTDDPLELARRWFEIYESRLLLYPDVYWQAVNEPPTDPDTLEKLAAFELERMRLGRPYGIKCALFTFSVGNPDLDAWPILRETLQYAHQDGHILALNEYFPALPYLWYGDNQEAQIAARQVQHWPAEWREGWLMFRYRKVWRRWLQNWGLADLPIVLIETGSDRVALTPTMTDYLGVSPAGWREMVKAWVNTGQMGASAEMTYLRCLAWVDAQLEHDPYMLGACVFMHSDMSQDWYAKQWQDYDISGDMATLLYDYVNSV